MCRYVQKMTKLKSQITLKSQISKTLFLHEIKDLAKNVIIYMEVVRSSCSSSSKYWLAKCLCIFQSTSYSTHLIL